MSTQAFTIVSSSDLVQFNNWSAKYHMLLQEEKQFVLNNTRLFVEQFIQQKLQLISTIEKKFAIQPATSFSRSMYKDLNMDHYDMISSTDLNKAMAIVKGEADITSITRTTEFNKLAAFILFVIKDIDIDSSIEPMIAELENKLAFLKSLKDNT